MMLFYIFSFIAAFFYLKFINYFLIKKNFCLDKILEHENHKRFANMNLNVPISGGIYFMPLIFFLNFNNFSLLLICIFFLIIGLLSDIKILISPKKRLLIQIILICFFSYYEKNLIIDIRVDFINQYMEIELLRVLIISFFILVLVNGYNFIDGVNILSSLNILIILFFSFMLIDKTGNQKIYEDILLLMIFLSVFMIFNFFGKNFLGDGGIYCISLFIGVILIKISILNNNISPYYIANLLWYPAFENLFTILRRFFSRKKNYLPDNNHLHQLLFNYFKHKNYFKHNYSLSSFVGILINLTLLFLFSIGYFFYEKTDIQIILILIGISVYLTSYFYLKKLIKINI